MAPSGERDETRTSCLILAYSLSYVKNWRHPHNVLHCRQRSTDPLHRWNLEVCFLRYASGQTGRKTQRQRDRETHKLADRNTLHPYRGRRSNNNKKNSIILYSEYISIWDWKGNLISNIISAVYSVHYNSFGLRTGGCVRLAKMKRCTNQCACNLPAFSERTDNHLPRPAVC